VAGGVKIVVCVWLTRVMDRKTDLTSHHASDYARWNC